MTRATTSSQTFSEEKKRKEKKRKKKEAEAYSPLWNSSLFSSQPVSRQKGVWLFVFVVASRGEERGQPISYVVIDHNPVLPFFFGLLISGPLTYPNIT
jgi:hypothetical protein